MELAWLGVNKETDAARTAAFRLPPGRPQRWYGFTLRNRKGPAGPSYSFLLMLKNLQLLVLLSLLPAIGRTQSVSLPSFYTRYNYTAYTVFDTTSPDSTVVGGVGGSLLLRPDGTYEKHLRIVAPSGPYYFHQAGTFTLTGDSIRFAFTDLKGADVQRGTFRFEPTSRHLTLTILGYPTGNKGVYELLAADTEAAPAAAAPAATPKTSRSKLKSKRKPLR